MNYFQFLGEFLEKKMKFSKHSESRILDSIFDQVSD